MTNNLVNENKNLLSEHEKKLHWAIQGEQYFFDNLTNVFYWGIIFMCTILLSFAIVVDSLLVEISWDKTECRHYFGYRWFSITCYGLHLIVMWLYACYCGWRVKVSNVRKSLTNMFMAFLILIYVLYGVMLVVLSILSAASGKCKTNDWAYSSFWILLLNIVACIFLNFAIVAKHNPRLMGECCPRD